ncbi:hypothetical protein PHJA_002691700 [Phtheirospermum japonicum]|uniref:Uncharacterized protein n=1 Tax=Phtheirospermum japonicum TaxID=374723 RepID=A0A830DF38_9LAMI|nr:hypothetical protein PHJA_002691700 [Phtheirospermum japonicum]
MYRSVSSRRVSDEFSSSSSSSKNNNTSTFDSADHQQQLLPTYNVSGKKEKIRLRSAETAVHIIPLLLIICAVILWFWPQVCLLSLPCFMSFILIFNLLYYLSFIMYIDLLSFWLYNQSSYSFNGMSGWSLEIGNTFLISSFRNVFAYYVMVNLEALWFDIK